MAAKDQLLEDSNQVVEDEPETEVPVHKVEAQTNLALEKEREREDSPDREGSDSDKESLKSVESKTRLLRITKSEPGQDEADVSQQGEIAVETKSISTLADQQQSEESTSAKVCEPVESVASATALYQVARLEDLVMLHQSPKILMNQRGSVLDFDRMKKEGLQNIGDEPEAEDGLQLGEGVIQLEHVSAPENNASPRSVAGTTDGATGSSSGVGDALLAEQDLGESPQEDGNSDDENAFRKRKMVRRGAVCGVSREKPNDKQDN